MQRTCTLYGVTTMTSADASDRVMPSTSQTVPPRSRSNLHGNARGFLLRALRVAGVLDGQISQPSTAQTGRPNILALPVFGRL